jgi:membrane-associated phospholipid phosphatase
MLAVPATAAAQTQTDPAYRLETALDVPIVLGGAALASSYFFLDEAPGVACGLTCDRSRVNAFDRWAAGRYSVAWSRVGDVATAATLLFPPLVLVLDEGWKNGLNDSVVVAESALLTSALQVTLSYAVARPRPRVYSDAAPLEDRTDANAARSFFSGHVANTVAATVTATVALHRVGRSTLGWLVLGGGLAGSSLVGISRVLSGGHFPSDVLVGGAIGTGLGLLVPYLHASRAAVSPFTAENAKGMLVSGAW